MKAQFFTIAILFTFICHIYGQPAWYKKEAVMIPMRDGVKLHTIIYAPINITSEIPIIMRRTPYGAGSVSAGDSLFDFSENEYAREGYYIINQDIRGRFKSGGTFIMHRPSLSVKNKNVTDESTDTYDTIEWLIKNLKNNNSRVGLKGVSYGGWLAIAGAVNPHPALKASSPQAAMGDLFLGDDFFHNGAFRLSFAFEYLYQMEHDPTGSSEFPFPVYDLYDWYLKLGSLKNVNQKYFHYKIPSWNKFSRHVMYDDYWKNESPFSYITAPQVPMLHVGGYYDQEDINGPESFYLALEKKDTFNRNYFFLGPWYHGQWNYWNGKADRLGKLSFKTNTGEYFRDFEVKWFRYWLTGNGDRNFDEVYAFQTGSNQWKSYSSWPPKSAEEKKLYFHANKTLSFSPPTIAQGSVKYISDPASPVPYRSHPIEVTYSEKSRWKNWLTEDQRFVYNRPDVATFSSDTLQSDITVTGNIKAHLFASTTGTDADWVVKLIDVFPSHDAENIEMSQYQLPVTMEIFRGRFRKSFEKPEPLVPGKPEEFVINLHSINHTFKKGHCIMVQVQSSWFPLFDRNPQKYVPNIFQAEGSDFIKTTQSIYCKTIYPSYIALPVNSDL